LIRKFFDDLSNFNLTQIRFNRKKNGIDQKLKIILDENDYSEILEYTKCTLEAVEDFLDKK
jgi:hypothetical protein